MATASMTFEKYVERWEDVVLPATVDKPASIDTFKSHLKIMLPIIGKKGLDELTTATLQDLIRELKGDDERSARTVKAYLQTVFYVLRQAKTEGEIDKLPEKPKMPRVHRKQQPWLRWDEMRDVVAVAGGRHKKLTKIKMLFAILAETGFRIGEAVGLQWQDFNFEKRTISVQRSVYKKKIQAPKTPSAIRTIAMSTHLTEMLKEFKPEGAKPTDMVFYARTGDLWVPSTIWGSAVRVFAKLNMGFNGFHQFRRGATTLYRNIIGMPLSIADYRTGHASQSLTDGVYCQTRAGDDKIYADRIGELLFGDGLEGLKTKYGYTIAEN
jgi:integrase